MKIYLFLMVILYVFLYSTLLSPDILGEGSRSNIDYELSNLKLPGEQITITEGEILKFG